MAFLFIGNNAENSYIIIQNYARTSNVGIILRCCFGFGRRATSGFTIIKSFWTIQNVSI